LILLAGGNIKFFYQKVPSIEENTIYEDEVNLLNTLRDSDMTSEEFINSLVDYRMQAVSAQRAPTDYEAVSDDGIFVKSLRDSYPEITDEEIADELFKARSIELRYYNRSDETAVHDATSGRQLLKKTIKSIIQRAAGSTKA
jgi:hypothetical protein